jgi:hypothetical protein
MSKSGLAVMASEINTDGHKFSLADFDYDPLKAYE